MKNNETKKKISKHDVWKLKKFEKKNWKKIFRKFKKKKKKFFRKLSKKKFRFSINQLNDEKIEIFFFLNVFVFFEANENRIFLLNKMQIWIVLQQSKMLKIFYDFKCGSQKLMLLNDEKYFLN